MKLIIAGVYKDQLLACFVPWFREQLYTLFLNNQIMFNKALTIVQREDNLLTFLNCYPGGFIIEFSRADLDFSRFRLSGCA